MKRRSVLIAIVLLCIVAGVCYFVVGGGGAGSAEDKEMKQPREVPAETAGRSREVVG